MHTTKNCPHCKKEVDKKATKCPYCQSDLRMWARRHPIGTLIIAAILAPVIMSILVDSGPTMSAPVTQTESIPNMKKNAIESFSRAYIKGILKSPSTAKFNYFTSIKVDPKDPNLFEAISDVTSQNSFGAMLTNSWSVKARYIGADTEEAINEGSNWRIVEVYFDGDKVK